MKFICDVLYIIYYIIILFSCIMNQFLPFYGVYRNIFLNFELYG